MSHSRQVIKMSDDFALEYDAAASTNNWHGPEVLFGLMYAYLKPGQKLLDVGIGTGLSSLNYYRAGLQIYGVDGSSEMLKICRQKKITIGLEQIDLTQSPDIFPGKHFDHVISNGVFHIIGDLDPIFYLINQKIKQGGIFGFTVDDKVPDEQDGFENSHISGIFKKRHTQSGTLIYKHQKEYVLDLLHRFGFERIKKLKFQAYLDEEQGISYYFKTYIARRIKNKKS